MKQNKVEFSHIQALVLSLQFSFVRIPKPDGTPSTTTGCWAFLPNGYQIGYGESACVDPANFNQADGEKYSKDRCITDATNNLWEKEGYLLSVTGSTSDGFVQSSD